MNNYLVPWLTRREYQVLVLVSHGHATERIANNLHVSGNTVKNLVTRLYIRFGIEAPAGAGAARGALVRAGFEQGFLTPEQEEIPEVFPPGIGKHPATCFRNGTCPPGSHGVGR